MADEQLLIKKRANVKGRLTLFNNHISNLPEKLSNELRLELELRISKLELLLDTYNEIQGELECIASNPNDQLKERDAFECMYFKAVALAKSKLGTTCDRDCVSDDNSVVQHNKASIKLPVIQLAKFNGTYGSWLEFRDTYLSLIHDNPDLTPINKFHYLRSSLEGSALLVIKSVEFSSNNYSIAWKLICDRFDNKRMLIANHVKSLFNVYSIQKDTSFNLKRLVDNFVKNIRSLTTLGEPTDKWDTLLVYMLSSKFDPQTLMEWEKFKALHESRDLSFEDLLKFTRNRSELLETLEQSKIKNQKQLGTHSLVVTNNTKNKCPVCQSDHYIYYCKTFLALSNKEREAKANTLKLCLNCLKQGHTTKKCFSNTCKKCNKKHNTLICPELSCNETGNDQVALSCAVISPQGLLSTACVSIRSNDDQQQRVRIMLDSGSTSNFITHRLCQQLNLPTRNLVTTINSLNKNISIAKKCCDINIQSLHSNFNVTLTCIVISQITNPWPSSPIDKHDIKFPKHVKLSDPEFYKPSDIEILIGNGIFWDLLEPKQIKLKDQNITLHKSKLGWIMGGSVKSNSSIISNFSDSQTLSSQIAKFWELDNIVTYPEKHLEWSPEEIECEQNFVNTTTRLSDGRFNVSIPLKAPPSVLGDSYKLAKSRFMRLEKKLLSNPEFKNQYVNFMQEYQSLGHMRESEGRNSDQICYFAPHHGVERQDSLTTKLRVVFDCSAKSSSGYSFNELQKVGPTIQDDLFSILLRFRQHNIVLTADIEKMYRQVNVNENQRCLQQILWRDDPKKPLKAYELNTVTYGTASAPFLAIRCLKQLANECTDPFIQEIISKDFYVDDLITGAQNVNEALHIYTAVTKTLSRGCFPIRKWCSNNLDVVNKIKTLNSTSNDRFDLCPKSVSKTLGINWDHTTDSICFDIHLKIRKKITKRNILSTIAQLYDPLGLVTPAILQAKLTLQRLWLCKLSWDDEVSEATQKAWVQFISSLPKLNKLSIPRHAIYSKYITLELHIFTDASEEAYGACAYVRSVAENNEVYVNLLCSKNKVAPLKSQTLPRLELCGALLGTRLSEKIIKSLRLQFNEIFYWTDSTIVLGWLSTPTCKLQTFVRNRVAEIQSTTNTNSWKYVPTNLNPSDVLTRSMHVEMLLDCEQWWRGPPFLKHNNSFWPTFNSKNNKLYLPDLKQEITCMASQSSESLFPFNKYSNYSRMQRSMAYVLRFIQNTRSKNNKYSGPIKIPEIQSATYKLASISQQEIFPVEYKALQLNNSLKSANSLLTLNPFFDQTLKVIRVGGRLQNSEYDYNKKHPILLHKKHIFTKLLFSHEHKILMHAGPQHLLYSTRENYWTIGGRDLARYVSRNCNTCSRFRGKTVVPIMGNLPKERLSANYPFQCTALDYAGPVMIANKEGRGCRLIKSYICVFVCFTTKAIHIELVSDMSTANFISALKRFISRRGKPSYIYSDNGSNFVGAKNEINKMISSDGNSIISTLAQQSIKFSFCPPHSPHFGGLHEAGVKSVKHHLKRVLGNSNLTFEQLNTTLTQIEAILNSRPLSPLSSDPQDLLPLTPGHFLIGKQLTSLPEPDYADLPSHRLNRYQRIEQLRQQFWSRWHQEYITELQTRTKWKHSQGSLRVGDLVLIKNEQLPPMKWPLGRVVSVYPGTDGIARVADIKTASGTLRRSFSRICPLPTLNQDED